MTTPTATSPTPLRIAVLGAGKIGSTFAFQLARAGGHDVTVVARPGSTRLVQLQRDDGIVDVKDGRARVRVSDRLDEAVAYDVVIVTLLAHQAEALLPVLERSAAASIVFMFNTFRPERLESAIGKERCVFGMPFVQATLDGDGRLKATIGAGGQKTLLGIRRWAEMFAAAGLPARLEPDMSLWLRCHAPLCVAFESVSVAAKRRGGGASWGKAMTLARGVHACFALIRRLGFGIYPTAKRRTDAPPDWVLAMLFWSLSRVRGFRDLLASGEDECVALVATILAAAPVGTEPALLARIAAMRPAWQLRPDSGLACCPPTRRSPPPCPATRRALAARPGSPRRRPRRSLAPGSTRRRTRPRAVA